MSGHTHLLGGPHSAGNNEWATPHLQFMHRLPYCAARSCRAGLVIQFVCVFKSTGVPKKQVSERKRFNTGYMPVFGEFILHMGEQERKEILIFFYISSDLHVTEFKYM